MAVLTESRIADLLVPYVKGLDLPAEIYTSLGTYLDLLLRWNARTNLTAVRDPEQLVQRQVGESLLAARFAKHGPTILDFGSGAGFPGIPLQLARPLSSVTLAESQGKKANFLREAVRTLAIRSTVWSGRVEDLPTGQRFEVVTMRAVDRSDRMVEVAAQRVARGGSLLRYTSREVAAPLLGWRLAEAVEVPLSSAWLIRQIREELFHVEHHTGAGTAEEL